MCVCAGPVVLKYLDKDGDLVTITSQRDIQVRAVCTHPLKLQQKDVFCAAVCAVAVLLLSV